MSDASSIIVTLGLNRGQFKTEAERTKEDLAAVTVRARDTAGAVAVLERQLKSEGGGAAQRRQLSQLKSDLRSAQQEMKLLEAQKRRLDAVLNSGGSGPAPVPKLVPPSGGGHGGGGGAGQGQLVHSTRAVVEMMAAGQSPIQAATVEAPRIIQAIGGGLGPIMLVSAFAAVAKAMFDAYKEAKQLRKEIDALGAPMPVGAAASISAIEERLKATRETLNHTEEAQGGFWHTLLGSAMNRLRHPFSGNLTSSIKDTEEEDDRNQKQAEAARDVGTHRLAAKQNEETDLNRRAFEHGEASVEQERIKNKFLQERAEILVRVAKGELSSSKELIEAAQKRRDLDLAIAQRKVQEAERALALEKEIIKIKTEGVDVEARIAAARLKAAQETLKNGPKDGQEHEHNAAGVSAAQLEGREAERRRQVADADLAERQGLNADHADGSESDISRAGRARDAAQAKRDATLEGSQERRVADAEVTAKEQAVEDAKRLTAEKNTQLALTRQIAQMDGTTAEKDRAKLEGEILNLQEQLREGSGTYQPNLQKQQEIQAQLDQKNAERRAMGRSDQEREFARRENDIEANKGVGAQGQKDYLDARMRLNADRQRANAAGINDPDVASRLGKEAADLARQKTEIQHTEEAALRAARASTNELNLQVHGLSRAATEAGIIASYEERILAARRDGNVQLASELSKQRELALLNSKIDHELMTPQEQQSEREREQQRARAAYRIQNREDRHQEANAANAAMDPIGARKGIYQPDRRPQAKTDPQQHPDQSKGAFNDGNIVSGLKDVVTAIHDIPLKNQ